MDFTEHALAAFGPGKVAGDRQREVHQRYRRRRLAEPTEAARRTHLVGDQVGHLVEVTGVDGGEFFHLAHPLARIQSGPRTVVERLSRGGNRRVDVARAAAGASPIGCSECGEMTAIRFLLDGSRQRPPMKSWL